MGNIRASAAENLTGETGAAGEAGAAGETGAPGAPGTQISLDEVEPPDECEADGDIYIYLNAETGAAEFYECTDAEWTLVWPVPTAEGATPAPTESTNG